MTIVFYLALLIYVVICGVLVALILMQEGKGGGLSGVMGASMGETFGFGGANKQVRRYTAICATVFLVMSILLTFIAESAFRGAASEFLQGGASAPTTQTAPAPGNVPATEGAPAVTTEQPAVVPPPAKTAPAAPAASAPAAPAEAPATN